MVKYLDLSRFILRFALFLLKSIEPKKHKNTWQHTINELSLFDEYNDFKE